MWLFDLFKSKTKNQKKEFNEMNYSQRYSKVFSSLNAFAETQLMIFRITDRDLSRLFSDEDKKLKMLFFFGGAADYATQRLNLDDDEALKFIAFFIVLTLYNGDYKKMDYAKIMFMTSTTVPELVNDKIVMLGFEAYKNMFKKDLDQHEHSLILKKLLRD